MQRYPQDKSCSVFLNSLPKGLRSVAARDVPICASCRSRGPESGEGDEDEDDECLFEGRVSHTSLGLLADLKAGFRVLLHYRRSKRRWSYEFMAHNQRPPINLRAVYSRKLKPADIDLKKVSQLRY